MKVIVSFDLPDAYLTKIRETEDAEVLKNREEAKLPELVTDADVLFAGRFNPQIFRAASKLRWVHSIGAGVDRFLFPEFVESEVQLTNSSGVHSTPMAEHALAIMLMFTRRMHKLMISKAQRRWDRMPLEEIAGKTCGIVGLGKIGTELAKKCHALGIRVLAVKRNPSPKPDFVDQLGGREFLPALLQESNFVVLTLPFTRETKGMIGEDEIRAMRKNGYLINLSRGALVNESALIKALKEERIAGAGLDVFETEPLDPGSELWALENVILTPHVAGSTPQYYDRAVGIFCENMRRFAKGKPLMNLVDKKRGY